MSPMRGLTLIAALLLAVTCVQSAPFFEAIVDALSGDGRRSYGYNGYGFNQYGNGYSGVYGYAGGFGYNGQAPNSNGYVYRNVQRPTRARHERTWRDICKVQYPDSIGGVPGASGVVCPV